VIALSVNVNKIALIRNSREGNYPSVVDYAATCIAAGADGITVHPRPDQRHIRPQDVLELSELCRSQQALSGAALEFNIEGNPFAQPWQEYPGLLSLVEQTRPQQCTLVPDSSTQLTSDHGFDLTTSAAKLKPLIAALQAIDVRVSLFMDPDKKQLDLARELGVERIELYTGPYAAAKDQPRLLKNYFEASQHATDIGLGVNAGHDLNLHNLGQFAPAPGLLEVSIGHALIVDAIAMGLTPAVIAYKALLEPSNGAFLPYQ